jgi:hypothetical protein
MAHIIIGSWSSKCSECGGNASCDDTAHILGGPHSAMDEGSSLSDQNGCGATFDEPPFTPYAALDIPAPW